MTPEEAYEEALRRIRETEETGALELDLKPTCIESTSSGVGKPHPAPRARSFLVLRDMASLAGLTSLQSLDLYSSGPRT